MVHPTKNKRISRRDFCYQTFFGGALVLLNTACRTRMTTLKYPTNAEEIADFFELFIAADLNIEGVTASLGLNAEPRVSNPTEDWRSFEYENPNELVRRVDLATHKNDLESIYIYYANPIDVSFGRLESMLGQSKNFGGPVGKLDLAIERSAFAVSNISPGEPRRTGPPPITSYGFKPERWGDRNAYKGDVMISCNITENNLKRVDWIRYQRYKA